MSAIPIYIVAPAGSLKDALVAAFPGAIQLAPPLAASTLLPLAPGLILADLRQSGAEEALAAGAALVKVPGWTLAAVSVQDGASLTFRTVSIGYDHPLQEVVEHVAAPSGTGTLLELPGVLAEIAKARHDINNPLTSALAEVQILLLDAEDGEVREALETVQEQLRRLRDMVAATRHLRTRRHGA